MSLIVSKWFESSKNSNQLIYYYIVSCTLSFCFGKIEIEMSEFDVPGLISGRRSHMISKFRRKKD